MKKGERRKEKKEGRKENKYPFRLVDLVDLPVWAIFAAIIPGFILTVLFFFDHNVSSLLSQKPDFKLQKGFFLLPLDCLQQDLISSPCLLLFLPPASAFNWDFFVIGILVFICALLGIPPTNGLIPQAPLHVRSLAKVREIKEGSKVKEIWMWVVENRVSNLMQSLLIGITLTPPLLFVLSLIPRSLLSGLFLFMGFASFQGNQVLSFSEVKLPLWDVLNF